MSDDQEERDDRLAAARGTPLSEAWGRLLEDPRVARGKPLFAVVVGRDEQVMALTGSKEMLVLGLVTIAELVVGEPEIPEEAKAAVRAMMGVVSEHVKL